MGDCGLLFLSLGIGLIIVVLYNTLWQSFLEGYREGKFHNELGDLAEGLQDVDCTPKLEPPEHYALYLRASSGMILAPYFNWIKHQQGEPLFSVAYVLTRALYVEYNMLSEFHIDPVQEGYMSMLHIDGLLDWDFRYDLADQLDRLREEG